MSELIKTIMLILNILDKSKIDRFNTFKNNFKDWSENNFFDISDKNTWLGGFKEFDKFVFENRRDLFTLIFYFNEYLKKDVDEYKIIVDKYIFEYVFKQVFIQTYNLKYIYKGNFRSPYELYDFFIENTNIKIKRITFLKLCKKEFTQRVRIKNGKKVRAYLVDVNSEFLNKHFKK